MKRSLFIALAFVVGTDALIRPSLPSGPLHAHDRALAPRTNLVMGRRTPEQRAAFPAARDTIDVNFGGLASKALESKVFQVVKLAALVAASGLLAQRLRHLPILQSTARRLAAVALTVVKVVLRVMAGPASREVGSRVVTRVIDWGVPAVIVICALSAIVGGDDEPEEEEEGGGGSVLGKLLKKGPGRKAGDVPKKEYIVVESLGDKLSSMAYTVQATTSSKMDAARAQRSRHLARRFGDELGDIGDAARAGVAAAEATWRRKAAAPAAAATTARADLRSISVQLGGLSSPRSKVGDDDGASPKKLAKERRALKKKLKRAEARLSEALEETAELEASFLRCASEALGDSAWEQRAALGKLVSAPLSWELTDVPLPYPSGEHAGKRAFVLDFEGDVGPAQVSEWLLAPWCMLLEYPMCACWYLCMLADVSACSCIRRVLVHLIGLLVARGGDCGGPLGRRRTRRSRRHPSDLRWRLRHRLRPRHGAALAAEGGRIASHDLR